MPGTRPSPQARQVLRRRAGSDDGGGTAPAVSFRSSSTAWRTTRWRRAFADSERLRHYRPWLLDLRLDRPHQLDDRIERLFLEKAATGRSAFNRLFDETMSALRFDVEGEEDDELPIEPTLNLLQDASRTRRAAAAEALAATFSDNLRLFTLITNTLAKDKQISDEWRGFSDVADARHPRQPRRASGGGRARAGRERRLSRALAPLLRDEGPLARARPPDALRPQRPASRRTAAHHRLGTRRAPRCWTPIAASRPRWRRSPATSSTRAGSDAPVRPGKSPGAFAHPTVPSVHPYVLLNYQGKPRDVMTPRPRARPRRASGARRAGRVPSWRKPRSRSRKRPRCSARC